MRIGLVQTNPSFGEVAANVARALELMDTAQADLWVLPELFCTGYQFVSREEVRFLAEPIPEGPTSRALVAYATRRGCHIVAGLAEAEGANCYNAAVLAGPSGLVARYRKVHLFSEEKRWFDPGNLPFPVAAAGPAQVGLLVCFDHLFPEAARTLALRGADVIAHPANLVMKGYAQLTMRTRALENGVFAATANRVGREARGAQALVYTGESQVVSPGAEVLLRLAADREDVGVVKIDPAQARDKALNPYNDRLADRRPGFYLEARDGAR
jgi:5-aminopentanamidase